MSFNDKFNKNELILIYLFSSFVGIISTFLVMLLASLLSVVLEINNVYISTISAVCLAIGSFLGGFFAGKKIGSGGIVSGLIVSLIIFLFIFIISLILEPTAITLITLIHFIITVLACVIGSIVGVNNFKSH